MLGREGPVSSTHILTSCLSLLDMWRSVRWLRAFYPDVLACFLGMAEKCQGKEFRDCWVRGWVRATDWQGRNG